MITGEMTINPENIVRNAIGLGWTAEQLAQSFYDMPVEVAQELLDGTSVVDEEGVVLRPSEYVMKYPGEELCTR